MNEEPTKPPLIYGKIAACLSEIEAVGKDHKNSQQGYMFRSLDDFYDSCQPVLARHRVFIAPTILEYKREEKTTSKGAIMMTTVTHVRFKFFAEDGSFVECDQLGEGADSGDKSSNKAASQAMKYALQQVFAIRVNGATTDSERDSPEFVARKPYLSAAPPPLETPPKPTPLETPPKPTPIRNSPEKLRALMLERLAPLGEENVTAYALQVLGCLPGAWPFQNVPTNKAEMDELFKAVQMFSAQNKSSTIVDKPDSPQTNATDKSEWFWDAIIVLPRAGTNRADYLKAPDTIRSLYDAMKAGDAKAQMRLWGVVKEWHPEPFVGSDGKEHQPDPASLECRKALTAFSDWHQNKGKS